MFDREQQDDRRGGFENAGASCERAGFRYRGVAFATGKVGAKE